MNTIWESPWLAGIVCGIVVALISYLFTRKKTSAEIEKLKAESEKTKLETEKLKAESEKTKLETEKLKKDIESNTENVATISYQFSNNGEHVFYNSEKRGDIGFDFKGSGGKIYQNIDGKNVAVTPEGTGNLKCDNAILNIQRTNKVGRYELWLQTYFVNAVQKHFIPKDDLVEGKRRIKISFDVKVSGGHHTLKFIFKGKESEKWLGAAERRFTEETWTSHEIYVFVKPTENCQLRIDDQELSNAPSSIQIRNFVLTEKK